MWHVMRKLESPVIWMPTLQSDSNSDGSLIAPPVSSSYRRALGRRTEVEVWPVTCPAPIWILVACSAPPQMPSDSKSSLVSFTSFQPVRERKMNSRLRSIKFFKSFRGAALFFSLLASSCINNEAWEGITARGKIVVPLAYLFFLFLLFLPHV